MSITYEDAVLLKKDFATISLLAGFPVYENEIEIDFFSADNHSLKPLTPNKQAIYSFFYADKALKIGKAGPKSNARFQSQHYYPNSSRSNLAKSLIGSDKYKPFIKEIEVGTWIKQNTNRINFIFSKDVPTRIITLFECFLQARYDPEFEGY